MPRYLPREGLTIEAAAGIGLSAFHPVLTGSLLLGLLYCPKQIQSFLPAKAWRYIGSAAFISSLKVLLSWGILQKINSFLSRIVLNNFTTDNWKYGKEIVVVTGASSGMGAAITRAIAMTSDCVIALDLYPPELQFPSNVHYYKCDVGKSAEIGAVAKVICKKHGDPTVLINNAGISVCRPILHETEEQIRKVFDVNTIAHFLTVKEFLPAMVKQNHGHIVTIASMSSYSVHAQNVDYGCSKASALAFHEGLAQEIKSRYNAPKVRTTIVNPAYVRTPLLMENLENPAFNSFVLEPETVADAIVKQLHSGNGGHIILPSRYVLTCGLRGWPSWLQELARNGINQDLAFLGTTGLAKVAGMD